MTIVLFRRQLNVRGRAFSLYRHGMRKATDHDKEGATRDNTDTILQNAGAKARFHRAPVFTANEGIDKELSTCVDEAWFNAAQGWRRMALHSPVRNGRDG